MDYYHVCFCDHEVDALPAPPKALTLTQTTAFTCNQSHTNVFPLGQTALFSPTDHTHQVFSDDCGRSKQAALVQVMSFALLLKS